MIAIVMALPRELAGLVQSTAPEKSLLGRGIYLYRLPNAVIVAAGMGSARAALAVESALGVGGVTMLVSAGLAGSCTHLLKSGDVVEAGIVVDSNTGERYAAGASEVVLVSTDSIASVREKARLARSYLAGMVDMEAATVARLASAHRLAFRAIKGVSDAHDFELEALNRFVDERGQFRTAAFTLHTAVRPAQWGKTMELGRNSKRALAALTERLRILINENSDQPLG